MQTVSEVMTRNVQFISPQDTVRRAAQMMDELNVGALPVCDGERLVGIVTDRDIVVRATSAGIGPEDAVVNQVMSTDVRCCFEDQSLDEVMQQMGDTQIRRVPVVSHDDAHRLVGIVSLGDLATKSADGAHKVEQVVEKVSSPSEPDRSSSGSAGNMREGASTALGSNTGTATGLAGSDIERDKMNAQSEVSSTGDPSDTPQLNRPSLATTDPSGGTGPASAGSGKHADRKEGVVVRRTTSAGGDTSTGESGAPAGTDATGVAGASGGTAGVAGSPGSDIGARP